MHQHGLVHVQRVAHETVMPESVFTVYTVYHRAWP